jgi:hypothetical protein
MKGDADFIILERWGWVRATWVLYRKHRARGVSRREAMRSTWHCLSAE